MEWSNIGQAGGMLIFMVYVAYEKLSAIKKEKNKPDLSDPDYSDLFDQQLFEICEKMEAMRVSYWSFTNGTMTADGFSMKNLSMMAESNRAGVDSVLREMQNIPYIVFKRNLNLLRESETLIITHEHDKTDTLGLFHQYYGLNSNIYIKVYNGKMWTGLIGVNLDDKNVEFSEQHLAWLSVQASIMGGKLKSFGKKQ